MATRRGLKLLGIAWLACAAWLGCNQLLGNESAEFDPDAAARLDGSTDGTTTDGTTNPDGNTTTDGGVDGDIEDAFDGGGPCVDLDKNPFHCGACKHDCVGGACVDGRCLPVVIAQDVRGPTTLAIDGTHVYWINELTNQVWSVPKAGGTKQKLYEGPDGSFPGTSLATHAGNVYFPSSGELDGGVLRCAAPTCAGGPAVVLGNLDAPTIFITPDGNLYLAQSTSGGTIERCPLPCALGTELLISAQDFATSVVVGNDGAIYWGAFPGRLRRYVVGGALLTPVSNAIAVLSIQPVGDEVYYIDDSRGPTVLSLDGGATRRLKSTSTQGRHLLVNGNLVYASESNTNIIYACDRDGGCDDGGLVTIAKQQSTPRGIAMDSTFIFWANEGTSGSGGQIMRLAR